MPRAHADSFSSLIEVFPPSFAASESTEPLLGLSQKTRDFVERVRRIQHLADSFLIADVKDPSKMKLSTVISASILRERIGVDAIPVIAARDSNRPTVVSSLLTAFSLGLRSVMLVWGDRYGEDEGPKNVYDFKSLSQLIGLARDLSERSGTRCRILAPIDLTSLDTEKGLKLAKERIASGADLLLAQPPTTDSQSALPRHSGLVERAGLAGKVLLNVFPFRNAEDVAACRAKFGWELPNRLDTIARKGENALLSEAKQVADAVQRRGLPGIYVTTRGKPEIARFILD